MRSIAALLRYDFLTQTSYRISTVIMLASFLLIVVPVYFIGHSLQGTMAEAIRNQGDQYFGFLVVGLVAQRVLWAAMVSLPNTLQSGIRTGTLEAFFATPVGTPTLVTGLMTYKTLWGLFEGCLLLGTGWLLGARIEADHLLVSLLLILLITIVHIPFGLLASAGILAFRTSGPMVMAAYGASVFLGGVYYPTHVIPSWMEGLSAFVPLTYGLRALRRTLMEGLPIGAVMNDVLILVGFIVLLGIASVILFRRALLYARQSGSLAQY
ncbi:MAG TPA: ABC transporter permease [Longimicrobiaceae bacterium]|nr:ABC transporter permease [Longimicrobiaceae bacterium]